MDWGKILPPLISAAAAISGMLLGWLTQARNARAAIQSDATKDANIMASLTYIGQGVEEIRLEQKDQGRRFDALAERVARVEESTKSAHKRIDRLEGAERGADD